MNPTFKIRCTYTYMGDSSKFPKSTLENQNLNHAVYLQKIKNSKLNGQIPLDKLRIRTVWSEPLLVACIFYDI